MRKGGKIASAWARQFAALEFREVQVVGNQGEERLGRCFNGGCEFFGGGGERLGEKERRRSDCGGENNKNT